WSRLQPFLRPPSLGLRSALRPRLRGRGARRPRAAGDLLDAAHQRLVHRCERPGRAVGVLADLVGDLDEPLEVDAAVPELLAQLFDEPLEVVGELLNVFQRCHNPTFPWLSTSLAFPA